MKKDMLGGEYTELFYVIIPNLFPWFLLLCYLYISIIGASVSEPHLVELLDGVSVCLSVSTICRAVNRLQLLLYVFLCHVLIQK